MCGWYISVQRSTVLLGCYVGMVHICSNEVLCYEEGVVWDWYTSIA